MYKGKGAFLGSGFLPPNAYVTLDCEFILNFRKGDLREFPRNESLRHDSKFKKKQHNAWFTQVWTVTGKRQAACELERRTAAFPNEIANRLIRMFCVKGEIVLGPFLGSGTTIKAAMQNARRSIGYEIDSSLLPIINSNIRFEEPANGVQILVRDQNGRLNPENRR